MSIDRLTTEDLLMLRGDEIWPQDIGALAIFDGHNLLDPAGRLRIEAQVLAVPGATSLSRGAASSWSSRSRTPTTRR
jgi:hypothetical protein